VVAENSTANAGSMASHTRIEAMLAKAHRPSSHSVLASSAPLAMAASCSPRNGSLAFMAPASLQHCPGSRRLSQSIHRRRSRQEVEAGWPASLRFDRADYLTQPDAHGARALAPATHDEGVAILQERPLFSIGKFHRLLTAFGELHQRTCLGDVGPRQRARSEQ